MRGQGRHAAALTAMALAAVWPGAAASATVDRWHGVECATGRLTHAAVELENAIVVLFGSAAQCVNRKGRPGDFAVATFQPGAWRGVVAQSAVRDHREAGQERAFGIDVGWAPRFGVCLMASPSRRIACGEITIGAGDRVAFRAIGHSHALVAAPVDAVIQEVGEPSCNSCF